MSTTQHGNEKGKKIERPRTPEKQQEKKMGVKPRPSYLKRRFHEGKWFCDCENGTILAHCFTSRNIHSDNYKKPYWICSNPAGKHCDFFVWAHEEEIEKRRLAEYEPLIVPLTPRSPHTPWTIAKENAIKRKVQPGETQLLHLLENETGNEVDNTADPGPSTRAPVQGAARNHDETATPSRKRPRSNRTPPTVPMLKDINELVVSSLPSPRSSDPKPGNAPSPRTQAQVDNNLESAMALDSEKSLTMSIIQLLAEDGITLKASTRIMLDHEIDMVMERHEVEAKRFKETNSKLRRTVNELTMEVERLQAEVTGLDEKITLWTGLGDENESDGLYND